MDPLKLEKRIAKLEREVSFVKAQGLSIDEQNVLLNQENASFFKKRSTVLIWVLILIQFVFVFYLFFQIEFNDKNNKNFQGLENQDKNSSVPKRNQPFQLP